MHRQNVSSGTPWEDINAYSRIVRVGQLVYVSGTTAADESGTIQHPGDMYGQAAYILRKIEKALQSVGANLTDVVRTTVYLTDMDQFAQAAKAHKEFFDTVRPANTLVEVSRLATPEMLVEIAVDAVISSTDDDDALSDEEE
jgi:enamine deaminase RidA (YjgF/YER057c/UK114 family)